MQSLRATHYQYPKSRPSLAISEIKVRIGRRRGRWRAGRGDEPVEVEVVAVKALPAVAVLRRGIRRVFRVALGTCSGAEDEIRAAIRVACASSGTFGHGVITCVEPLVGREALAAVVDELVVLTTGCHCKEECEPYPHLARRFAAGQPLRLR